jgi:hypothetical protein
LYAALQAKTNAVAVYFLEAPLGVAGQHDSYDLVAKRARCTLAAKYDLHD